MDNGSLLATTWQTSDDHEVLRSRYINTLCLHLPRVRSIISLAALAEACNARRLLALSACGRGGCGQAKTKHEGNDGAYGVD